MPNPTYLIPPDGLRKDLAASGVSGGLPDWQPLRGGRSNQLWRFATADGQSAVLKLYSPDRQSAVFPNMAAAEIIALTRLRGTGLAPEPFAHGCFGAQDWIVYAFQTGQTWQGRVADVARLLRRLHDLSPPIGLRAAPDGSQAVLAQGESCLTDVPNSAEKQRLLNLRPGARAIAPCRKRAFLHGDVVPGNILQTPEGLRLIDWQCPATGDPAEDAAIFLSPAMQQLAGLPVLSAEDIAAFWDVYGVPEIADRWRALRSFTHWRMAAYCLKQASLGEPGYREAFDAEIAALAATDPATPEPALRPAPESGAPAQTGTLTKGGA